MRRMDIDVVNDFSSKQPNFNSLFCITPATGVIMRNTKDISEQFCYVGPFYLSEINLTV